MNYSLLLILLHMPSKALSHQYYAGFFASENLIWKQSGGMADVLATPVI